MYHLRQTFPKDIIFIRGDFNARHLAWGYDTSKPTTTIQNICPLSLTSNICKLMELMALARIQWHLNKEDRLYHCKSGFRSGLSTKENFLMLHHDVLADPSSIQPKTIVAEDVQKAFD
ncbi:hypothetical protein HPB47_017250 [Ixodes persulcatus]|uniref:Uncharacterized protein n=1 Tax=Ixodes persulcatus TaxID=34615 RepID=A0AC60QPS3_IXOPE|nr:hypothetical protein HPB47_017250 [Ixodes persulcatus]